MNCLLNPFKQMHPRLSNPPRLHLSRIFRQPDRPPSGCRRVARKQQVSRPAVVRTPGPPSLPGARLGYSCSSGSHRSGVIRTGARQGYSKATHPPAVSCSDPEPAAPWHQFPWPNSPRTHLPQMPVELAIKRHRSLDVVPVMTIMRRTLDEPHGLARIRIQRHNRAGNL